jgi:hypothetical protein
MAHFCPFAVSESLMETQIAYIFPSAQLANRFLNTLKHWSVADVKVKLHKENYSVLVSYYFEGKGFDSTCSELDDLAGAHEGHEV